MSRILLVDDSTHAQRMGERILAEEGYEVVTVSNAESALIRLEDVDPDLVLADTVMPGRTGFELCQYIKMNPRHRHVRVVLTAGVLEPLEEEQVSRVQADGSLKKPFEASVLLATVKPLAEAATRERAENPDAGRKGTAAASENQETAVIPFVAVVDREQIRAAVTVALDAAMDSLVDEISRRVVTVLASQKPVPPEAPALPGLPAPSPAAEPRPPRAVENVRRVNPLRVRSSSVLGLDIGRDDQSSSS